ncbi:MAG: hypothetical protein Q8O55_06180 [Dehalococcoidales bacterium]|nr:hypothetical protein [Dehalococcoidales bacterium]
MRSLVRAIPAIVGFGWVLWYSVKAEWSKVVAPNWHWVVIAVIVSTTALWLLTNLVAYRAKKAAEGAKKEAEEARKRIATKCPKCNKPWARALDRSEFLGREQNLDYDTHYVTDVHRDNEGHQTGTTERTVRIPYTYNTDVSRYYYHCKFCGHKWTRIS